MDDKKELPRSKLLAIRAFEKDILDCNNEIARLTLERQDHQQQIRKLMGERAPNKTTRPWELIKKRVIDEGRPITIEEAYLAVSILDQFAGKIVWRGDLLRSIGGTDDLKVVRGMVGLTEWPDDIFKVNDATEI